MKILNFLLRMVFGAIGIQIINAVLISQNISFVSSWTPALKATLLFASEHAKVRRLFPSFPMSASIGESPERLE